LFFEKSACFKKNLFVVAVSSELITIYKFNIGYFYMKVFGFDFEHLKNSAIFAPETLKMARSSIG
jgi:hypothetical protein